MSPYSLPPAARSPWASLPEDLVRLVAWRLLAGDLTHYVRFRAVCTSWRSSTVSPRGRGVTDPRFHPRRWMMFPEGQGLYPGHEDLHEHVRFFNLDSGVFVRVRLPLFSNHCILDSAEGLLVLQRDEDTAMRLLHPLTGDIVELPPLTSLAMAMRNDGCGEQETTVLKQLRCVSASVSVAAGGVVRVMVILRNVMRAAVATSQQAGSTEWTLLPWRVPSHYQPLSSRGNHYLVGARQIFIGDSRASLVFRIDAHLHQDPRPELIATIPTEKLCDPLYLLESDSESEVLVVGHNDMPASHLAVHRLSDLVSERYDVPLESIGDRAILVGGKVMWVSSRALPTITGDTVVCRHQEQLQFMQYCLGSGSWSPATDECSMSGQAQGPCSLIHHVFTCCNNRDWNKGLMSWRDKDPFTWKVKQHFRDGA